MSTSPSPEILWAILGRATVPTADPSLLYSSPGDIPNKADDEGPRMLAVLWTLSTVSTAIVAIRLWTKQKKAHRLYLDDMLMCLALVLGLLHATLMTVSIQHGEGRHFLYLSEQEQHQAIKYGMIGMAWGNLSPMAGRIAFCVTMLFLTRTDGRVPSWPILVFIACQLVFNIAAVIFFLSQCGSHLSALIESNYDELALYCLDPRYQTDFGYFVGAFNCLTDAFLTVLPATLISHTRLSFRKKIGLALLLCLSILALAAAVVKTYEAKALSEISDYTYDLCDYVIWVSIELNVVIIVASIPILRVLFRRPRQPDEITARMRWDTVTTGSVFSKKKYRRGSKTHFSISSEENMVPQQQHELPALPGNGIHVTRDIEVTYQPSDAPHVHAALVGLLQGEIANPKLVRR
ncbi:uncharacterized protein LTR77_011138 [Saxophila tyrrhenica]|uniref:Rhodopsin domain-containing protein n=1 Tax=Saxophila tyrrhenica TaxID=1690608 RepID=A0AAV9NXB1_9PEZI|nr:hypothetical protein LTR77_011138 [Saxophila tyrrhenica]